MAVFTDINRGSTPNDGTGDTLRAGATTINDNYDITANQTEENTFTARQTFSTTNLQIRMDAGSSANYWEIGRNSSDGNFHISDDALGVVMKISQSDGGVFMSNLKSGATQVAAGAAADELWTTSSHATLPDNVVMIGV
jgi:uncharacterized protein YxjI